MSSLIIGVARRGPKGEDVPHQRRGQGVESRRQAGRIAQERGPDACCRGRGPRHPPRWRLGWIEIDSNAGMRRRKGAFGLAERVEQEEPYPWFVRVPPPAARAADVDD